MRGWVAGPGGHAQARAGAARQGRRQAQGREGGGQHGGDPQPPLVGPWPLAQKLLQASGPAQPQEARGRRGGGRRPPEAHPQPPALMGLQSRCRCKGDELGDDAAAGRSGDGRCSTSWGYHNHPMAAHKLGWSAAREEHNHFPLLCQQGPGHHPDTACLLNTVPPPRGEHEGKYGQVGPQGQGRGVTGCSWQGVNVPGGLLLW